MISLLACTIPCHICPRSKKQSPSVKKSRRYFCLSAQLRSTTVEYLNRNTDSTAAESLHLNRIKNLARSSAEQYDDELHTREPKVPAQLTRTVDMISEHRESTHQGTSYLTCGPIHSFQVVQPLQSNGSPLHPSPLPAARVQQQRKYDRACWEEAWYNPSIYGPHVCICNFLSNKV